MQARILVYVLLKANAKLLKAHGPLHVVGTVEVVGKPTPAQRKYWEGRRLGLDCSAAPEMAGVSMQLHLRT